MSFCFYRIAQEAVRNSLEHAGASRVSVQFSQASDAFIMAIEDDGRGFDPDLLDDHSGLGLVSMRERVQQLGGEFLLDTKPGMGTKICVRIPKPR